MQPGQSVQGVEQQRQQLRHRVVLLGDGQGHLGKIGSQRQKLQVLLQFREQLLGNGLSDRIPPLLLKQGKFRVGQKLAGRLAAAFSAFYAACLDRDPAQVTGQDSQQLVIVLVFSFLQNDPVGFYVHERSPRVMSYVAVGRPLAVLTFFCVPCET